VSVCVWVRKNTTQIHLLYEKVLFVNSYPASVWEPVVSYRIIGDINLKFKRKYDYTFRGNVMHFYWVRTSLCIPYSQLAIVKADEQVVYKPRHSRKCSWISCLKRMFVFNIQTWILIWSYRFNLSVTEPAIIFCILPLLLYCLWRNFKYHENWIRSLKINRDLKVSRSIRKVCWNLIN
jgi:hypothetical protein